MRKRLFFSIIISGIFNVSIFAQSNIEDAINMFAGSQFGNAIKVFEEEYAKSPKDASLNYYLGACKYEMGDINDAVTYLEFADKHGNPEAARYLGKVAYSNYKFADALKNYARYEMLMKKARKNMPTIVEHEINGIRRAETMLNHIEKIVVVDSITVDKNDFFKRYKIAQEVGKLASQNILDMRITEPTTVFIPESGERMYWAMPDSTGDMRITQSTKLIDSSWDTPQQISMYENEMDSNYPFMQQDGSTLYFASNGVESIGGYDIFVTRKDDETGEYLQPQNIGMPFNSPDDDYLLVIDNVTGAGWWATDRNHIPGKVTIYVYIPNAIRENYPEDNEYLLDYAALRNYKSTWEGNDYTEVLNKINSIKYTSKTESNEFLFRISPEITYTSMTDFKDSSAASQMRDLLLMYDAFNKNQKELDSLRLKFNSLDNDEKTVESSIIIKKEISLEKLKQEIYNVENSIRKLEQSTIKKQ